MKAIIVVAVALLSANSLLATVPSANHPSEAALNKPLNLPVTVEGKPSGSVTAPKGTVVTVRHVRQQQLQIDFEGSQAWVKRADTDFDRRLKDFKKTKQAAQVHVKKAQNAENALAKKQDAKAKADFQAQHAKYSDPLDKPAYNQTRSVVDYYDAWGRRYHIGVFGQRIYD